MSWIRQRLFYTVNCVTDAVFAYGATGAGKTFTMLGTIESPGIIFSAVMALFAKIEDNKSERVYDVSISYLEVNISCIIVKLILFIINITDIVHIK